MKDYQLIKTKHYPIWIGNSLLENTSQLISLNQYSSIAVLTDKNVASNWLNILKKGLKRKITSIIIPPGENSKTIEMAKKISLTLLQKNFDRKSLLINLGGGVIGDLGGFVASIYKRGIDFLQIPTSLLAMVDASIGGKTGVNLDKIKNSLGVFNHPIGVLIDVATLKTLPKRELISGVAEMIKHGIIFDRDHFQQVVAKPIEKLTNKKLIKLITDSIKIKLKIINLDLKEKGPRKILNFGHTIGHAIESLTLKTTTPLLHGEAVAIGMVAESKLAQLMKLLSIDDLLTIETAIKKTGLPTRIKNLNVKEIEKIITFDKKNLAGKTFWSLPTKIGSVKYDIKANKKLVVKAIEYICL